MKRNLFISLLLGVAALLGGCREDSPQQTRLVIDPSDDIVFEAGGGTVQLSVETDADWKVISDQSWCRAEKTADDVLTVSAEPNNNTTPMPKARITVFAGKGDTAAKEVLCATQQGRITEPVEDLDLKIELTEKTAISIKMSVVPSDKNAVYYFDILRKETLDEHHEGDLNVYVRNFVQHVYESLGSMEAVLDQIGSVGDRSHSFESLTPDTEYIALAVGLAADGTASTKVFNEPFVTDALQVEDEIFKVTFSNYSYDGVDILITPPNDVLPFYATIRPAFGYDQYTDEELLQVILDEDGFIIPGMAFPGEYEWFNENVCATDTGYLLIVFGWSGGVPATPLERKPFRTLPAEVPPAECTFAIDFSDVSARSFKVDITPSDGQNMFMYDLISAAEYEEHKNDMKQYVADYVAADIEQLDYNRERGNTGYAYSYLEPNTTYYVWACCIDEFGKPAADVYVSQPVTTKSSEISDTEIHAAVKYFDGDELYALDNVKYADCVGKAYVQVDFTTVNSPKIWYGTMVKEDPTDPSTGKTDDEIAQILIDSGLSYPTGKLYTADWNEEYVILGVAVDSQDNRSEVLRRTITFTREGASPIEEFVPAE